MKRRLSKNLLKHQILRFLWTENKDMSPQKLFESFMENNDSGYSQEEVIALIHDLIEEGMIVYDEEQDDIQGISNKGWTAMGLQEYKEKAWHERYSKLNILGQVISPILSLIAIILTLILFTCEHSSTKNYEGTFDGKPFVLKEK